MMSELMFIIPMRDRERVEALALREALVGFIGLRIVPQPFDPFGPEAETQPFTEVRVTVSYDPAALTPAQLRATFTAHGIHIMDIVHVYPSSGINHAGSE